MKIEQHVPVWLIAAMQVRRFKWQFMALRKGQLTPQLCVPTSRLAAKVATAQAANEALA